MSILRSEGFQQVRRLLGFPKEQRPRNDQIVGSLLAVERLMSIQSNSMNAGWSIKTLEIPSVVDQAEYNLTPTTGDYNTVGKVLFAYRELDGSNILPVPFTDFLSEFSNQKYEFWNSPENLANFPYANGEKLGFYRNNQTVKMRIFPIPAEVKTYTISYAVGVKDWTRFAWTDLISFPEFCDYLWRLAAMDVVRFCEWEGYTRQENRVMRDEMRADISASLQSLSEEWRVFIRHVKEDETISHIGNWYE